MHRRSLLSAAVGVVTAGISSIARALPVSSSFEMNGHDSSKKPLLTDRLRHHERESMMVDEPYADTSELKDALFVIRKYGVVGIVMPDQMVDSLTTEQAIDRLIWDKLRIYRASEVNRERASTERPT